MVQLVVPVITMKKPFAWLALASTVAVSCLSASDGDKPEMHTNVADWRDEIIYQVLVDRFANGDAANDFNVRPGVPARYHGGDWAGLEAKLDYIEALGVTTLWISPIVKNVETDAGVDGYHGYWAQDLTRVNPHFGDLAALRRLVAACHARGLKVIVDIVTNHMGQLFYYDINGNGQPDVQLAESGDSVDGQGHLKPVKHLTEYDPDFDPRGVQGRTSLGESGQASVIFVYDPDANKLPAMPAIFQEARAYHRMGRVVDFEATVKRCASDTRKGCAECPGDACVDYYEQTELGDFPGGLKDVATELPEVREAMIDVYTRWVLETDIDGYRIDTLKHVEHGFWQAFAPAIRQRVRDAGKKNFLLFGESFDGNDARNGSYTRDGEMDSVFNFAHKFQVFDDIIKRHGPTNKFEDLWAGRASLYGATPQADGVGVAPSKLPINFLDNHDVPRFLYLEKDTQALTLALTLLMTEQGIPCVYYGTEQGFSGGNDPMNREDLWSAGYATDGALFAHVARLTRLRRGYPALTRGDQKVVYATPRTGDQDEDAGILAFQRALGDAGDEAALVVLNANAAHASHTQHQGATMKTDFAGGTALVDVLDPARPGYTVGGDGTLLVEVPAMGARLLIPASQVRDGL